MDKLGDNFGRKLRKYKERRDKKAGRASVGSTSAAAELANELDDDDDLDMPPLEIISPESITPPAPTDLVRTKSFPMPPISVAEACECLEFVEHDFYIFKNAETDAINVVYKRDSGGLGLIEPEN